MSGHSKWATTKHKKAAIDAKRGKLFAKLIKNIEIAARLGGGDPDGNPSLYDAIYKAKKASMPADNIARAVKRGAGAEDGAANYEDIVYEGYAPAGVGLIIECLTDNRNRAAAEVRSTLTKGNGSLATSGSDQQDCWNQCFDILSEQVVLYPVLQVVTPTGSWRASASPKGESVSSDFKGIGTTGVQLTGINTVTA